VTTYTHRTYSLFTFTYYLKQGGITMKNSSEIIKYPIGKESTTIKNVFKTLSVLDGSGVKSAISRGQITIDGDAVTKASQRVKNGQTIRYTDMEILVYTDEEAKRKRLTQTVMTGGASYGNTFGKAGGVGSMTGPGGR